MIKNVLCILYNYEVYFETVEWLDSLCDWFKTVHQKVRHSLMVNGKSPMNSPGLIQMCTLC